MTDSKAADFWDKHYWEKPPLNYWGANPQVKSYINRRITGDPQTAWMDWFAREYVPDAVDRGLCLACGAGTAEIHAMSLGLCRSMDACDISKVSLDVAKKRAGDLGLSSKITYWRCDLNEATFDVDSYNLVLSSGGLHHIEEIEHLVDQIKRSLRPGGLLAVDEYIGAPRLQFTDEQLGMVIRVVESLPKKLRTGKPVLSPSLDFMLANDPSEAVRSSEILPLLEGEFEILEKRLYGGGLLHPLFACGAIRPELLLPEVAEKLGGDVNYADLLELILVLEETLTDSGALASDYVLVVARKV